LDCNLIAENIKELVKAQPNLCVAAIRAVIKRTYQFTASYRKCWEAKQKAIAIIFGDWDLSYMLLPRWLEALRYFCQGSITDVRGFQLKEPNEMCFDRALWAFGPCVEGFMHCPPILSIDATFLYGKYKEYLIVATALDGNNHIFPIAFALVESESADTWGWFLESLLPIVRRRKDRVALISDRHPGIISAVKNQQSHFYKWVHRFCLRHIRSNFNERFRSATLKKMVWDAGCQAQIHKYNSLMAKIKELSKDGYNYLQKIPKEQWTLAYDENGARYGQMTTNLSESFNGVLKGIRSFPVAALAESTWYKIVGYFAGRREQPDQWGTSEFTPSIAARIAELEQYSGGHHVTMFDRESGHYEITTCYRTYKGGSKGGNKQVNI
jgi:hypothetical protein